MLFCKQRFEPDLLDTEDGTGLKLNSDEDCLMDEKAAKLVSEWRVARRSEEEERRLQPERRSTERNVTHEAEEARRKVPERMFIAATIG